MTSATLKMKPEKNCATVWPESIAEALKVKESVRRSSGRRETLAAGQGILNGLRRRVVRRQRNQRVVAFQARSMVFAPRHRKSGRGASKSGSRLSTIVGRFEDPKVAG